MKTIIAIAFVLSVVLGAAVAEEADLKVGSVQLLPEFSEKMTGTIDSRRGEISRDKQPLVRTEEDIADVILIATTYSPRAEKTEGK